MADIAGYPYFEVQFDKNGAVHDENELKQVLEFLENNATLNDPVTDLLIIAHGWNNDMAEARDLYRRFFEKVREVASQNLPPGIDAKKFAVLGIFWPSKKFAEENLIASGAAGAGSPVTEAFIVKQLDSLKGVFDKTDADAILEQAKALVPQLEDSPNAQRKFADLIRSLPDKRQPHPEDASDRFFNNSGDELMKKLSRPVLVSPRVPGASGGAAGIRSPAGRANAGGAAGIGDIFSGIKSAARNLLNYTTYYQMKERAGTVGSSGVNSLIRKIREMFPALKLHLIGHSFGGRLVTAAADGPADQPSVKPDSMTLLQAAFSHNAFGDKFDNNNDGVFRKVVTDKKVSGPIVITCTPNDQAVGRLYPLASLVAGQNASKLGDANDPYGGIGCNGAQKTPEVSTEFVKLTPVSGSYRFQTGKLYNLNADACITDHSDICKEEVAYAVLSAVATT
jgi:hypothetical protein